MKKLLALIVLFYAFVFGQGWNTTVTAVINEPNLEKIDNFSNASGIHVLVKRTNGNIVYYKLNSSGTVVINPTTLESDGDWPAITGTNDKIFAFYSVTGYIKGKYSTNGGSNWISLPYGVHIAYSLKDSDPYYETYYRFLYPNSNPPYQWVNYKNVTDYMYEVGGKPSIVLSENRIHVSYNTSPSEYGLDGQVKTRDKYDIYWQTPQSVVVDPHHSMYEKLLVRGSTLYLFYEEYADATGYLRYKTRAVNGTWTSSYSTLESIVVPPFDLCKTINDDNYNIHLIYYDGFDSDLDYKYYDGSWHSSIVLDDNPDLNHLSISSVSNDVFTLWRHSGNYLWYKQYDAIPLPPPNLSVEENQTSHHPYLSWTRIEPDIDYYLIEKNITSCNPTWQSYDETNDPEYTDENELYCTLKPPEHCIQSCAVGYRVSAIDINSYSSDPSDPVIAYVIGHYPSKRIPQSKPALIPVVNKLEQNYPNPFNPNTSIYYSLERAGMVTLKVFNMLGQEVAELVNEVQSEGYHSVEFNAADLPSGIYVYQIKSGEFSDVGKMILAK
jgi:hypothetical protein